MNKNRMRTPVGRRFTTEGRKTLMLCVSAAVLIGAFAVFHTWTRIGVIHRGYELGRAQVENARLKREVTKYSLEVESRQTAAVVDREAHARLNMEKASKILVLRPTATASGTVVTAGALAQNGH